MYNYIDIITKLAIFEVPHHKNYLACLYVPNEDPISVNQILNFGYKSLNFGV